MQKSLLNIVVALHCEAKGLIEQWGLKRVTDHALPFPLFASPDKTIHLIISGVGKVRAAAATTFVSLWTKSTRHCAFLNVGIAGSSQFAYGEAVLAHKIIEQSTQRCWYPFIAPFKDKKQGVLITHDVPQCIYPALGLLDMEGAAFFQIATQYVTQEQVYCVKIISDNHAQHQQQINPLRAQELVANNLMFITEIKEYLLRFIQDEYLLTAESPYLSKLTSTWHFTHYQNLQLKDLLRRWQCYFKAQNPVLVVQNETSANAVLIKLRETLDQHAYCLS